MSPAVKSAFLAAATERGYIHQCTDWEALDARLATGTVTGYIGYDCTADSLHVGNLFGIMLLRLYQCECQMGGCDQWGNLVSCIELARRSDGRTLFGLTTPLIATASGAKMGKSVSGAVWLNAENLSPYHYWQFWRNTEDADVGP